VTDLPVISQALEKERGLPDSALTNGVFERTDREEMLLFAKHRKGSPVGKAHDLERELPFCAIVNTPPCRKGIKAARNGVR
jgi:hypothetical protein